MKKLLVIRHAKSNWKEPYESDFERKLNERGKKDATFMAELLLHKEMIPHLIVSSSAKRTMSTAKRMADVFEIDRKKIVQEPSIYEASKNILLQLIWQLPNEADTIFLIGHNPGVSDLLTYLTDEHMQMPTCAVAQVQFDINNWNEVSNGTGILQNFEFPKKY